MGGRIMKSRDESPHKAPPVFFLRPFPQIPLLLCTTVLISEYGCILPDMNYHPPAK